MIIVRNVNNQLRSLRDLFTNEIVDPMIDESMEEVGVINQFKTGSNAINRYRGCSRNSQKHRLRKHKKSFKPLEKATKESRKAIKGLNGNIVRIDLKRIDCLTEHVVPDRHSNVVHFSCSRSPTCTVPF